MDFPSRIAPNQPISPQPRKTSAELLQQFGISPHKSALSKPSQNFVPSPPQTTKTAAQQVIPGTHTTSVSAGEDVEEKKDSIEYAPGRSGRRVREPVLTKKIAETSDLLDIGGTRRYRKPKAVNVLDGDLANIDLSPAKTARGKVRQEIATYTVAKRNRFLIEKKDYWLPLLPESNYVQSLVDQYAQLTPEAIAKLPSTRPYKELEQQPRGVRANMKPYQLSGLSFLVYLHRNGCAGILGDEMGLGKTLQTLSLFQYLKENEPKPVKGAIQHPSLVVCPLSVLSSWMAEAKKWTPGLKVIRFHGPVKERDRLKKVVTGDIDFYGNLTSLGAKKSKSRSKPKVQGKMNANGQEVISLLSDDDDDDDDDLGVDLVVTTYEAFRSEQSWFKRVSFVWRYVVLDEGHTIKNHESLVSKSLQSLRAEYRLVLSGTPLQNNLTELWSLLHWLYPEVFTDKTQILFNNSFNLSKGHFSSTVLDSSRRLLELIMLRRMKNSHGVDLQLPPKTETVMYIPLSPMQQFWYRRLITKADTGLLEELFKGIKGKEQESLQQEAVEANEATAQASPLAQPEAHADNSSSFTTDAWQESQEILEQTIIRENYASGVVKNRSHWQNLMNLVMRLRQVSNHPYQIEGAEPDPYYIGEHVITASGKFLVLEKLINELVVKQRKRVLIFSGFTQMLNLIEELLVLRGGDGSSFRFARIDGSTCRARRNLSIRLVNDLNSEYRVMLISTRAGGLGINLASASEVVLTDMGKYSSKACLLFLTWSDWNPSITLQAESRAHRIGQTKQVNVYKLVSQGTVEEQMLGRIQKKLYLSTKVTESMSDMHTKFGSAPKKGSKDETSTDDMPELSVNQLMTLIRRGASALSRPAIDVHSMIDWDWNQTLANCKDQPADITVKQDTSSNTFDSEAEHKWLSELERVESCIFNGTKILKDSRSNREIADEYFSQQKADRRKGKEMTVMVDGFAIDKRTIDCKPWEAVKTIAGDGRFADPKREKKAVLEPQSHCQVCFDGGELHCCQLCPRAYHYSCLERDFQAKAKSWQFNCPQHQCYDCEQKTTEAGGMLFRCRWCERAFCEDCMDFDKAKLIGGALMELEVLGVGELQQAYWVQCHVCTAHFDEVPTDKQLCDGLAAEWKETWERKFNIENATSATDIGLISEQSTRAGSMTDATTIETPGIRTPAVFGDGMDIDNKENDDEEYDLASGGSGKRKVKLGLSNSATKKSRLGS